jgi:putative DNA methylase
MTTHPKKLIEVALPLPEINDASSYDKMPGIGPHPKGIHHWWARLPLPCARAILFASVVTDPSDDPAWMDKSEAEQDARREELFNIVRRLMRKKLHEHPEIYEEANTEMLRHCGGKLPPVLDPFSGGGSIPLEAARLGFEAHAADLNPVAVLLNKCNLELAPRWAERPPVNPDDRSGHHNSHVWKGSHGLAADVRYYGRSIRALAEKTIGEHYPKVRLPKEHGGGEANVLAWVWARTVASQNPVARGAHVPLVSNYWLSTNAGKLAWIEPVIDRAAGTYRFEVKTGTPTDKATIKAGTKLGRGAKFKCLLSDLPLDDSHIKSEGQAGRIGYRLLAVVAEGRRGRVYCSPTAEQEQAAQVQIPDDGPTEDMAYDPRNIWCVGYGLKRFDQLFTPRQMLGLTTLVSLVRSIREQIVTDARAAKMSQAEAEEYATCVQTFLGLSLDRCADFGNAACRWGASNQKVMNLFSKQAIPMIWDFAEANLLADSVGGWITCSDYVSDCIRTLVVAPNQSGKVHQADAASGAAAVPNLIVSTDPPYYDNMSYASLSDFFYVWLRRSIGSLHLDVFQTILVPKAPELIADAHRFGGEAAKAKEHFESGFRNTFTTLREKLDPRYPLTVYYAFKQEDEADDGEVSDDADASISVDLTTGWETLLEALISSGFTITATWPVRAAQKWRQVSMGTSSLASYIVLACRPRPETASKVGRNAFVAELKRELPSALRHLQQGNVAPVDFAQAAIGPGMAVFSRYAAVLESSGKPMSVRTALALINGIKDEVLGESVEELDKDTRWSVLWYEQAGFDWAEAGDANLLANAQATAVNALVSAGIVTVSGNRVRLLRADELPTDWDPQADTRLTVWEMTHHLLRLYYHERRGDEVTASLLHKLGAKADVARDLAYKLFTVAENKKRSAEAQAYNALVMGWPELIRLAQSVPVATSSTQGELL